MKIVAIIPARYKSTRFEGKPLADICGKPMVKYVYDTVKSMKELNEVYVATDDKRIYDMCLKNNIKVIMTPDNIDTPTERIYYVSEKMNFDYYLMINGDEPLIEKETINSVIPKKTTDSIYVANIMTTIKNAAEVIDYTNLKIITNERNEAIYISRSPIPYPKGSLEFTYKKHVGVYAYNKKALDFYHKTKRGINEKIEDIDLLRFVENNIVVNMINVDCETLSVDTPKDLEKVVEIVKKRSKK